MSSVVFEKKNAIATIRLNRPEKMNAFNRDMALMLQEKLDECKIDKTIRCVIITGTGKAFSAGQDLSEVVDPEGPGMRRILSEHYNPIITRIRELKKPVLAAINGVAAGAGANIPLCCDIVVAKKTASFLQAFSKIGLIPDSGGTFFLPRLVGWQRASALMMMGDTLTADEAYEFGMLYKVFADENFEDVEVLEIIEIGNLVTTKEKKTARKTKDSRLLLITYFIEDGQIAKMWGGRA